ncbi:hypothetical protein [Lysobacter gummosus]|uniref:hypothetical protein n=1 Tax=Lysobacter gummosus TaxID=262324 RepID=UPI00362A1F54
MLVIPAKAGIQRLQAFSHERHWIPAFAGMTRKGKDIGLHAFTSIKHWIKNTVQSCFSVASIGRCPHRSIARSGLHRTTSLRGNVTR